MRFELRILNDDSEEIATDYTTFDPAQIDEFGGCEMVDIHVAAALRGVRRDAMNPRLQAETTQL